MRCHFKFFQTILAIASLSALILSTFLFAACGPKTEGSHGSPASSKPAANSKPEEAKLSPDGQSQKIIVTINHAYEPSHIIAKAGVPLLMEFFRDEDVSSCARDIEIPSLAKRFSVPNHSTYKVTLPAQNAGKLPFHCTMDMMQGLIEFK
ncbi:MAG: cupredoxin domain-containing protein [Vampirovibrionales bacterium]|nr:cupredoxin domain-containing protein [Vampirovibrionales bacterium]